MRTGNDPAEGVFVDSARQVAALVWPKADNEAEILLVTSRNSGHWLLPKGWHVEGKSAGECALQEAFEEAVGVLAQWPEREQRRREWVTLTEAAARVTEPDLAEFLRRCDDRFISQHFRMIPRSDAISDPLAHVSRKKETKVITNAQCRAARALIDWSPDRLSVEAGLSTEQLEEFERGGRLDPELNRHVRLTLERGGVIFLSERRGRGHGVRLKFDRQLAKRIDIWENEGGPTAADDIL